MEETQLLDNTNASESAPVESTTPDVVEGTPSYTAPSFDFLSRPKLAARHRVKSGSSGHANFFRSAKWSPDGSALVAEAEDRSMSLFQLPTEILERVLEDEGEPESPQWEPYLTLPSPDAQVSYSWYPLASSQRPEFFCFMRSVRDHPVHLLDAFDGRRRASYPIIDHRERFVAPHSMVFTPDATKLYCGFENAIEIFDISAEGEQGVRIHTSPSRSSRQGQKGIISSLSFSPDHSGLFAAGSFSSSIGLYDSTSKNRLIHILKGVKGGGVTQVEFHPFGHLLYSASRRSNEISVWDIRNTGQVLSELTRPGGTNQRLGFGLEAWGRYLSCGDQEGVVRIYDVQGDSSEDASPLTSFSVHEDAVGSTSFHPYLPLLLTCSGSRHFPLAEGILDFDDSASDDSQTSMSDDGRVSDDGPQIRRQADLSVWRFQ